MDAIHSDAQDVVPDPLTIADLLSLPSLESVLFHSVSLYRPTGPIRRWAIIAIVEELNAAIRKITEKRQAKHQRLELREKRRSLKRKRRAPSESGDGTSSSRKRIRSGDAEQSSIKAEADNGNQSLDQRGEQDGYESGSQESSDSESEMSDEDSAEEDQGSRFDDLLKRSPENIPMTVSPEAVWNRLQTYYDLDELNDLETTAISPSDLAPIERIREQGFSSSIRERPPNVRVKKSSDESDSGEDEDEDGTEDSDPPSPPIDFALVPGLAYDEYMDPRRIDDEQLAYISAGLASAPTSPPPSAQGTRRTTRSKTPISVGASTRRSGRGVSSAVTAGKRKDADRTRDPSEDEPDSDDAGPGQSSDGEQEEGVEDEEEVEADHEASEAVSESGNEERNDDEGSDEDDADASEPDEDERDEEKTQGEEEEGYGSEQPEVSNAKSRQSSRKRSKASTPPTHSSRGGARGKKATTVDPEPVPASMSRRSSARNVGNVLSASSEDAKSSQRKRPAKEEATPAPARRSSGRRR
ncbi:unnamed protein product [Sympodiomycopsis kandeliae]